MTAVWLLGWAKLSSDPSERSRSLRKCRPIMAINNNGGMHLALWLMALSHSSFTWLLCGHQQVRSNVMLSKWALHRVAYNLGLETSAALTKTKKKKKKVHLPCHYMLPRLLVQAARLSTCARRSHPSILQHRLRWHGRRSIVSVWSGNKAASFHSRTHTVQILYMSLSDTCPLNVPPRHLHAIL